MRLFNPKVRTGQGSTRLSKAEFQRRWKERFADPAFDPEREKIDRLAEIAWEAYDDHRKSPHSRKAGPSFADPDTSWRSNGSRRAKISWPRKNNSRMRTRLPASCSSAVHRAPTRPARARCRRPFASPPSRARSWKKNRFEVDLLDLSNLASEFGRIIFPCKACVSTAMPLCHWPCSCYPNHYLGQIHDWMNEIYPRWVAAHGVMIVTPVHWYQAPSPLKLMMDRLVCADGGNPDPTTRTGKRRGSESDRAKRLGLPETS